MLLSIIFSVVFSVKNTLVADVVSVGEEGKVSDAAAGVLFVVYIVCIGTIIIIPIIASSLSGGMALNGVLGGMGNTVGMLGGASLGCWYE